MISAESALRDVVVALSAFGVGSALFAAFLCLRMVRVNVRRYLAFAAAKIGYAIVTLVILVRIVLPAEDITADAYSIAYVVGLAIAGAGFVGVGRAIRSEYVDHELRSGQLDGVPWMEAEGEGETPAEYD